MRKDLSATHIMRDSGQKRYAQGLTNFALAYALPGSVFTGNMVKWKTMTRDFGRIDILMVEIGCRFNPQEEKKTRV